MTPSFSGGEMEGTLNTTVDLAKSPYMVVDNSEWKRLWKAPCPLCRDPLLDHAVRKDLDVLLENIQRVQRGEEPVFGGTEKMKCLRCECFLPRSVLFNQILNSVQTRVVFKKEQDKEFLGILEDQGLVPEPEPEPAPELPTDKQIEVLLTLFDPIVGYDDVKELFRMALGASKPVHILLEGPPASAKTLFLMETGRLPASHFVVGGGTSKAGLTDALLTYRPMYLLVDEVETINNPRDYASLLHLMENQEVVETKYNRHQRVPLTTWVFAAGNDTSRLDPALISRFGGSKCVVHFKEYSPREYREITVNVLVKRESVEPEFAAKVADAMLDLQILDVRAAVRASRLAQDEEALGKVVETMRRRR